MVNHFICFYMHVHVPLVQYLSDYDKWHQNWYMYMCTADLSCIASLSKEVVTFITLLCLTIFLTFKIYFGSK